MESSTQRIDSLQKNLAQAPSQSRDKTYTRQILWAGYLCYLIINDIFMTVQAFKLAFYGRFNANLPFFRELTYAPTAYYSSLAIVLVPLWLSIFALVGLYRQKNLLGGIEEYQLVGRATSIGLVCLIVLGFLEPQLVIARGWVLMAWVFSFVLVASGRFLLRRGVYLLRRRGYFVSPAIIVGANDEGVSLARQLTSWSTSGLKVVGFIDKKLKPGTVLFDNVRVLGPLEKLDEMINKFEVEELILASSSISTHDSLLNIFQRYGVNSQVKVRLSSGLYEIITTGLTVNEFAYVPLVGINKVRLTGPDQVLKIMFDYTLAIPGVILISPLLLLIALCIKLDSPGPVIYKRRVMGVNGKEIDAYKFRTMKINGNEILAAYPELQEQLSKDHKLKDDPRVTRVGKILRKLSLDELPQVFNVLLGQMSLVGPRMISPKEMKKYNQWGINLLTVKPGMTGLWQVSGRSDISYEERVRLDMYYIRNWSIWLDLQLLWRTLPVVLKAHGAY